ncbi:alpha/beta hydrolase, partial [Aestuariivirga sp.]|uniref:alpha/beta hydrolase n=1 Tax=Aestuariivirga sp. TaxID=2650926 RepID=UPI00391B4AD8
PTLSWLPDEKRVSDFGSDRFALAFARIECHYFVNGGFFSQDGQLIAEAHRLRGIPGIIIQGRYDVVTPARTAWDLHRAWPEAEFVMVPDAGHTATEPGTAEQLVKATETFRHAVHA